MNEGEEGTELRASGARLGLWGVALAVTHVLASVVIAAFTPAGFPALIQIPVALAPLYFGVSYFRARVVVGREGLRIRGERGLRERSRRWADVRALRVDPPGGPRRVNLDLADGTTLRLPPLDDRGIEVVTAAFDAARNEGQRQRDG